MANPSHQPKGLVRERLQALKTPTTSRQAALRAVLHTAEIKVLALPQLRQGLAKMSGASLPLTVPQFGDFIWAAIDKWAVVVKQASIKAN